MPAAQIQQEIVSGLDEAASAPGHRARGRDRHRDVALGALADHLGYSVRRLQVWIFQDFVRSLAPFAIRPAQYSVLVVIGANPGLSQADLGARLGIERARLARLLDGLECRGFTRRGPARSDRRAHALHLTREGRRDLKRIQALAAAHEARLAERLGPDRRAALLAALRDFA